jgi:hypothetical protein
VRAIETMRRFIVLTPIVLDHDLRALMNMTSSSF